MSYKTFQYRAYTDKAGYARIDQLLRLCSVRYNAALEERSGAYRKQGKSITKFDQLKSLTEIRRDDPDGCGAVALVVLRGVLVRLDRAMQRFFERVKSDEKPGFPRFKSYRRWHTIELSEASPSMLSANAPVQT